MKIIKINDYEFKMIDNEKEIIIKRKENEDFIRLEENSLNRKFLQISKFKNSNEIELKEINRNKEKKEEKKEEIFNFENYLNEEEKKILEDLKEKSLKRFEKIKEMKKDEKYIKLLNIKKNFDDLIEIDFIKKDNSDYLRILKEIEKFENNFEKEIEKKEDEEK